MGTALEPRIVDGGLEAIGDQLVYLKPSNGLVQV